MCRDRAATRPQRYPHRSQDPGAAARPIATQGRSYTDRIGFKPYAVLGSNCLAQIPKGGAICVGAALCRERAAKQPQQFQLLRINPGAALRPFRDTRPLPQVQRYPRKQCCTCGSWLTGDEASTGRTLSFSARYSWSAQLRSSHGLKVAAIRGVRNRGELVKTRPGKSLPTYGHHDGVTKSTRRVLTPGRRSDPKTLSVRCFPDNSDSSAARVG